MTNVFQYAELLFLVVSLILVSIKPNRNNILFAFYALVVVFVDIIAPYFRVRIGGSNHFLYNIYQPLLFLFFISAYYKHLDIQWKRISLVTSILWTAFFCWNIWNKGWNHFATGSFIFSCFIIIILSGYYLLRVVRNEQINNLFTYPGFWFAIAALSFFSAMAIIMGGYLKIAAASRPYFIFREIINVVHYILLSLTVTLLITGRKWQT